MSQTEVPLGDPPREDGHRVLGRETCKQARLSTGVECHAHTQRYCSVWSLRICVSLDEFGSSTWQHTFVA